MTCPASAAVPQGPLKPKICDSVCASRSFFPEPRFFRGRHRPGPFLSAVQRHFAVDDISDISPCGEKLHHLTSLTRQLRPTRFCLRILFQSSYRLPIKLKIHLTQPFSRRLPHCKPLPAQLHFRRSFYQRFPPNLDQGFLPCHGHLQTRIAPTPLSSFRPKSAKGGIYLRFCCRGWTLLRRSRESNCPRWGGSEDALLKQELTRFWSPSDRGSLYTPTHSFQPKSFVVIIHKLFIFCGLMAASLPAAQLHPM